MYEEQLFDQFTTFYKDWINLYMYLIEKMMDVHICKALSCLDI